MSTSARSKLFAILTAALLVVSALALSGCGKKVPDVVGLQPAEAVRVLQDAGYKLGEVTYVATKDVPLGQVATQEPAAGSKLKDGRPVNLAVNFNDGVDTRVPTVTGLSETTAVNTANAIGLVPLVNQQYSDTVAAGLVAAQVPEPEATVKAGSTLVIVVSRGKAPATSAVPDVKGKSQSDAESAIKSAGFTSQVYSVYDSKAAKGTVFGQVPAAGTTAVAGSKVQIVVSLGPGTGSATVPSVTGKNESDANKAITSAGLKTKVYRQYSDTVASGVVVNQFPTAGAKAAAGSEVAIVVSLGKTPTAAVAVPDVTGMTEADARAALENAGFTVDVQTVPSDTVAAGTVGFQFPSVNTQAAPGSPVLVVVSEGAPPE